jgi:hypothetical protein
MRALRSVPRWRSAMRTVRLRLRLRSGLAYAYADEHRDRHTEHPNGYADGYSYTAGFRGGRRLSGWGDCGQWRRLATADLGSGCAGNYTTPEDVALEMTVDA